MRSFNKMLTVSLINDGIGSWRNTQTVSKSDVVLEWHKISNNFASTDTLNNFERNIVIVIINEGQTLPNLQFQRIGL